MTNQSTPTVAQKSSANPYFPEVSTGDMQPTQDAIHYLKSYARERPEVAALWCFGIGFILGWKLKPW